MKLSLGQCVRVNERQSDPDTGVSISGWIGKITEIREDLIDVAWDSQTLAQLPDSFIIHSIDGGYDYSEYSIESTNVEPISCRDSTVHVNLMKEKLQNHYFNYEMSGKVPPPFSGYEEAGPTTDDEKSIRDELLSLLGSLSSGGKFVAFGTNAFVHPGLQVYGLGDIGLPLVESQAEELLKIAHQAPYGKGSQTIMDTRVRSSREIDSHQISIANPEWDKLLQKILADIKKSMAIDKKVEIHASLYKLLLYGKGDFFLTHQDSEKEHGMFGTLVIGLPSVHTGGELLVRFDGQEISIDFSAPTSSYKVSYAAFYADCEHEIKPVRSGYRLCLVYNLLQNTNGNGISLRQFGSQVDEIIHRLEALTPFFAPHPKAILLKHQYTPANFSIQNLKGQDRSIVEALRSAADRAGYFSKACLITHYQMGEWESYPYFDKRYGYYEEEENPEMGEIYEQYTEAGYWAKDEIPGLGELELKPEDIIGPKEVGQGKPHEKEMEGFTGNAGMTLEFWYHYGAVIIWPRTLHTNILTRISIDAQLEWISFYIKRKESGDEEALSFILSILSSVQSRMKDTMAGDLDRKLSFNPLADALCQLKVDGSIKEFGPLLSSVFQRIEPPKWLDLLRRFGAKAMKPVFLKALSKKSLQSLSHCLDILFYFAGENEGKFVTDLLLKLPQALREANVHKPQRHEFYERYDNSRMETIRHILRQTLLLSPHAQGNPDWVDEVLMSFCASDARTYINQVLVNTLLQGPYSDDLLENRLRLFCKNDLEIRTAQEPVPPSDWSRKVPRSSDYNDIWKLLSGFMASPTQTSFDYVAKKDERKYAEHAIKASNADLKMETIKKGSPHTLRLTKTQAYYERALKAWNEDRELLKLL